MSFDLLKELTEAAGVSGHEDHIRTIIKRELQGVVSKMTVDPLGNLIAYRKGTSKKAATVMYSAHMDEIGFLVKHIDDKGFLRLCPVGGHDARYTIVQQVTVHGRQSIPGVVYWGVKPVHLQSAEDKKKTPEIDDLFVDTGLDKEQVEKLVSVGDTVTLRRETIRLGQRISGKAMDNRTAVYTLIESLKQSKKNSEDVYAVFSVQEEVGLRGAMVAAHGINPEVAIGLDTTLACDTPGNEAHSAVTKMGHGVGLTIMDGSVIADRPLVEQLRTLAEKHKIPHQMNILPRGGTDAGAMQRARAGCRATTISLPTRYIHSCIETIDQSDLDAKIALVSAFMKSKLA